MLTFLTEPITALPLDTLMQFIILYVAQSIAPNTQFINSEKCANLLFQKAGICMTLSSGNRGPIKKKKKKKKTNVLMEALLERGFVGCGGRFER